MREQRSLSTGRTERRTSGTGMKFVHSMKGSFLSLENKSFYCWDLNLYKKQVYLFFTILFYPQKTYFREELSWVKNKSRTVKSRIFRNFHLKHTFLNIGWTWQLTGAVLGRLNIGSYATNYVFSLQKPVKIEVLLIF